MQGYSINKRIVLGLAVLFAIGFQFLLNLRVGDAPMRLGWTDVLLPIALSFFLLRFEKLPALPGNHLYELLGLITLWLLVSFLLGIHYTGGEVQKWIVVNKLIGWFVLLAYFLCGAWMAREGEAVIALFLKCLFLVAAGVAIYSLALHWQGLYGLIQTPHAAQFRVQGFFANPNAYGIFLASVFVLFVPLMGRTFILTQKLNYLLAAVILLALYYSLSRSAWVGLVLAMAGLLVMRPRLWKPLAQAACAFLLLHVLVFEGPQAFSLAHRAPPSHTLSGQHTLLLASLVQNLSPVQPAYADELRKEERLDTFRKGRAGQFNDIAVESRMFGYKHAWRYWLERPVIGTGLGGFQGRLIRDTPTAGYAYHGTLHSTGVWLMTETGLLGFLLFLAFFLLCFIALAQRKHKPLCVGVASVLLVMLGASVGTEILYQRYFWFLLGMALVAAHERRLYVSLQR